MLAAFDSLAKLRQRHLLIAIVHHRMQVEPVNTRCDVHSQRWRVAVDLADFESLFAVNLKTGLRELRDGV